MEPLTLFGTRSCPYTAELREHLLADARAFTERDVEEDPAALDEMLRLTDGDCRVPVLAEDGRVVQIGWRGRGCFVTPPRAADAAAGVDVPNG